MIKMQCKVEGNRVVALDVGGISKIKNGDVFEIKNEDLIRPEIQFLISKNILSVVEETKDSEVYETKDYLRPSVILFECNVKGGRRLTLDSIKGTVGSGQRIEISASDVHNPDVAFAIKNNYISPVKIEKKEASETQETEVPEEATEAEVTKETPPLVEAFLEATEKEETLDTEEAGEIEEVSITDMVEKENKDEALKFRVNEAVEDRLKDLAGRVYEENTVATTKTESPKKKAPESKTTRSKSKTGTRKKRTSKRATKE